MKRRQAEPQQLQQLQQLQQQQEVVSPNKKRIRSDGDYDDKKEWLNSQGHEYPEVEEPILDYKTANAGIRLSISEGAGESGMCSGVITSSFLRKDVIDKDNFIIVAYSNVPRRSGDGFYWKFSGFTTCNFTEFWEGKPTLYINVLCANVPGVAQEIMKRVICEIGKKLADDELISAIQLSSLTYVIGYYYKKWGFRFYDKTTNAYDEEVNDQAATLPRIGPDIELLAEWDDMIAGDLQAAVDMNIPGFNALKQKYQIQEAAVASATRDEVAATAAAAVAAAAVAGAGAANAAAAAAAAATRQEKQNIARRERAKRRTIQRQLGKEMETAVNALEKTQDFMKIAGQYSVKIGNYRVQGRIADPTMILQRLDPGEEGWTMKLPAKPKINNAPSITKPMLINRGEGQWHFIPPCLSRAATKAAGAAAEAAAAEAAAEAAAAEAAAAADMNDDGGGRAAKNGERVGAEKKELRKEHLKKGTVGGPNVQKGGEELGDDGDDDDAEEEQDANLF